MSWSSSAMKQAHENCIAVTRNDAGEIVKCITCSLDEYDTLLDGGTPGWPRLTDEIQHDDVTTSPYTQGDAIEDAMDDSKPGARDHAKEPLPWRKGSDED